MKQVDTERCRFVCLLDCVRASEFIMCVSPSHCPFCQNTSFILFCVWNNLPSSFKSFPPSIQTPTCLPVSLSLGAKRKSIFRKYSLQVFLFLLLSSSSISRRILWREKGVRLMGPAPLRDFALLLFCLSFSLLCFFFLEGFSMKGRRRIGTSRVLITTSLGDLSMNKMVQGVAHNVRWWAVEAVLQAWIRLEAFQTKTRQIKYVLKKQYLNNFHATYSFASILSPCEI